MQIPLGCICSGYLQPLNTSFSYVFRVANSGRYGGIQFFTTNLLA